MSLILSVYSQNAFKEFNLPSINNSDYEITIREDYFRLTEDIHIKLEVMDEVWKIRTGSGYRLFVKEQAYDNVELSDRLMVNIVTAGGGMLTLIASYVEDPFHAFNKYRISGLNEVTIGRDRTNDVVYDFGGMVGRSHAVIIREGNRVIIQNKSANGIYVNSARVDGSVELQFGDYINIIGLHMVFLGSLLAVDNKASAVSVNDRKLKKINKSEIVRTDNRNTRLMSPGKTVYRRSPRYVEGVQHSKIDIEAPPQLPQENNQSLFLTIGPTLTMALPMALGCLLMVYSYKSSGTQTTNSLFMYSGLVMAVSSALIGVMWTLINRSQQKKAAEAMKQLRKTRYEEYLSDKAEEIRHEYKRTAQSLIDNYPDAYSCVGYDENSIELWSRNSSHEDFLRHRIGMGDVPFEMEINVPAGKFSLFDDDLTDGPAIIKSDYSILRNVPVTVDLLKHKLIGIVGGKGKKGAIEIARLLSAQIAANNCYTDVKLVYIYDNGKSSDADEWDFAKWLPHVWAEDRNTRYVASNREEANDVFYELGNILRARSENRDQHKKSGITKPYFILFLSEQSMIEGSLFSKYIFDENDNFGLTTVILAERYEDLPNGCEFIIENSQTFKGYYETAAGTGPDKAVAFDAVDRFSLERFARKLSGLKVLEIETGGEIPSSLTFFDMMGVSRPEDIPVREYWAKSRIFENIRGLIGQKAGGVPCYLDVHEKYHGPHGLIAGTTGSGKSETLQTYILSLAINYSPDDVAFFIIDYKGGGMANLFDGLPHMAGQISNLSGNQVQRAMISIKSENRRRQRIFNDNGVNNINAYTKMFKNGEAAIPVPHLFIIIDEFAELKREEPEFMRELISVAQVGRSLGVHLILATQKPSGTVDDNIWSNSRFRLCLRVQDKQDSMDMLHKPDAAYITQAGRCYLQVGNDELYELFQSGYSGAAYDASNYEDSADVAKLINLPGKVDMTGNTIRQAHRKNAETAWVEVLLEAAELASASLHFRSEIGSSDAGNIQNSVSQIYAILKEQGIDYGESKYNTARLQEFMRTYYEIESGGEIPTAETIIAVSQERNRKLPQQKEHSELDAVKDYLQKTALAAGYTRRHQLWMPVLRDNICLDEFDEFRDTAFSSNHAWLKTEGEWNLRIVMGKMDDPENQNQMPYVLDFAEDGNVAVCGSIVSGKSTALQTIAYALIQRYSPETVNIYAVDFSSKMMAGFESAPHFGGVMYENDKEKISKFFNMIGSILEERKKLFHGGNYKQYVRVNGVTLPAIFILIDNYGAFKQKTDEAFEEILIRLSKEGLSNGIYLIVSGGGYGINEITARVGENLNTVLTLALKDKFEYADLLHSMQISFLPESGVKGRGLAYYGSRILEYQTAVSVSADNDYERMEKIRAVCDEMSEKWHGRRARPVPEIPEKPVWEVFSGLEEYEKMSAGYGLLPIGYDESDASVYGIPLDSTFCYGIYGQMQTGKTNLLKACILAAIDKDAEICIVDGEEHELGVFEDKEGVNYVSADTELEQYLRTVVPEFSARRKRKDELVAQGKEAAAIFEIMSSEFKPIFFFLHELDQFMNMIYKSEINLAPLFENVIGKGSGNNIYFFADMSVRNRSNTDWYAAYKSFTGYRKGIHLGGKISDGTILDYGNMSYSEQSRSLKTGTGYVMDEEAENTIRRIVTPLVKASDLVWKEQ